MSDTPDGGSDRRIQDAAFRACKLHDVERYRIWSKITGPVGNCLSAPGTELGIVASTFQFDCAHSQTDHIDYISRPQL